jgi:hypothetical protein
MLWCHRAKTQQTGMCAKILDSSDLAGACYVEINCKTAALKPETALKILNSLKALADAAQTGRQLPP